MQKPFTILQLLLAVLFTSNMAFAQSPGWHNPGNNYLAATLFSRIDDNFFIAPDTGLIVTSAGTIHKTNDGAHSWTVVYASTDTDAYFRSIEFSADGQFGIAGALNGKVYRSTNRGEHWDEISANINDTSANAKKICGLAHHNYTFWGVGWWGSHAACVYKSTDSGLHWTTNYLPDTLAAGLVDVVALSADTIFASGTKYQNYPSHMLSIVLRSTDGGQSWSTVFQDSTIGGRIWKLQFINHQLAVGSIEPVYHDTVAMIKSTDGGNSWQIMPVGKRQTTAWGTQGIGFASPTHGWLGGYYTGMFETFDGGITWNLTNTYMNRLNRFFVLDSSRVYVSGGNVFKYTDTTAGIYHSQNPSAVSNLQIPAHAHTLYPVSPNPASGQIKIEYDLQYKTNTVVQIICIDGKQVFPVAEGMLTAGHHVCYWDGSNAPKGNYLIWLGTDEAPIVGKFILR